MSTWQHLVRLERESRLQPMSWGFITWVLGALLLWQALRLGGWSLWVGIVAVAVAGLVLRAAVLVARRRRARWEIEGP